MSRYRVVEVSPEGTLVPAERELVAPAPGEVRVAVEACGICHSDAIAVHPHEPAEPGRVPGHEVVGHVDALGAGVTGWAIGDRVGAGFLGGHCGVCTACRRGDFVKCTDQPILGVTVDGGYAEYVYVRASGLVTVPDDVDATELAPLLCAGFTTFNALAKLRLKPDALVAVQGIGGLGHLGIQYAKRLGARVVAIARGPEKAELATSLGADLYLDSRAADPGAALAELGGADAILATAASGSSMTPLLAGLALDGQLVVVGASDEPIEVTPTRLIFGNITLRGSLTGTPIENEDNVRFAVRHGVRAMVERADLEKAADAYARMLSGAARFRIVLAIA
jgi:propanol-preferring alcohol dehydrogenase